MKRFHLHVFHTGAGVQEPVLHHLSARVHLQGRTLWNSSPARLSPRRGPPRHVSCSPQLRLQSVHHGHLWLHHREPDARLLHDAERVHSWLLNIIQQTSQPEGSAWVHFTPHTKCTVLINYNINYNKQTSFKNILHFNVCFYFGIHRVFFPERIFVSSQWNGSRGGHYAKVRPRWAKGAMKV